MLPLRRICEDLDELDEVEYDLKLAASAWTVLAVRTEGGSCGGAASCSDSSSSSSPASMSSSSSSSSKLSAHKEQDECEQRESEIENCWGSRCFVNLLHPIYSRSLSLRSVHIRLMSSTFFSASLASSWSPSLLALSCSLRNKSASLMSIARLNALLYDLFRSR